MWSVRKLGPLLPASVTRSSTEEIILGLLQCMGSMKVISYHNLHKYLYLLFCQWNTLMWSAKKLSRFLPVSAVKSTFTYIYILYSVSDRPWYDQRGSMAHSYHFSWKISAHIYLYLLFCLWKTLMWSARKLGRLLPASITRSSTE